MRFRSTTYESHQHRRDEARRIYDAFLSVDAADQVRRRPGGSPGSAGIAYAGNLTIIYVLEYRGFVTLTLAPGTKNNNLSQFHSISHTISYQKLRRSPGRGRATAFSPT